jgi:hypothetical protein
MFVKKEDKHSPTTKKQKSNIKNFGGNKYSG